RGCNHRVDYFRRIGEDENVDWPGTRMQRLKTFFREALTRVRDLQRVVIDTELLAPAGIKQGRIDHSHACDVGVRLSRDVKSLRPGASHQRDALEAVREAAAVDVHNMQRGTRDRRGPDHLAHCLDTRAWLEAPETADVSKDGHVTRGRE